MNASGPRPPLTRKAAKFFRPATQREYVKWDYNDKKPDSQAHEKIEICELAYGLNDQREFGGIAMKNTIVVAALGLTTLVQLSTAAVAAPITLTMDEVASQPIDGLTVGKGGLDFTFSNPANTLSYNSVGPGTTTYITDPSIQGARSAFGVSFSAPVTSISFGLAELNFAPLFDASVTLSDGTVLLFDLPLVDPFAEGQFSWTGSAVTGFTLTPAAGGAALAFDNLRVDTVAVPEPFTLSLFGAGLAGAIAARRRKKKIA